MKKIFLILIVSVLLTACSKAASNNRTGFSRRTPVAQLPAQASQAQSTATPQSTATDASTATSIPVTATPASDLSLTPTATEDASMPSGLDIVRSQGYTMNDGFYVVGEILNNASAPMGDIKITVTYYYQPSSKLLVDGTMDGSTLLDVIPAYSKAPFVIGPFSPTNKKGGPVTWYDFHVDGQTATLPRQDLALTNSNSYSAGSWLYLRGDIQNTGTTDAKFVKAVITLYDSNNRIVGALSSYTDPSTIPAGVSAPFTASTEYWPNFDHFTVQVQGQ